MKEDKDSARLMHSRYLEYGRSFFWAFLFFIAMYNAWELQALNPEPSYSASLYPRGVLGAFQEMSVFGAGGALAFWVFHRKLGLIEEAIKGIGT